MKIIEPDNRTKFGLTENEKKTIRLQVILKTRVPNYNDLKPLFHIQRFPSNDHLPQSCERNMIKVKTGSFRNKRAYIRLEIRSFSEICHSGRYKISYWNGYSHRNILHIRHKFMTITVNQPTQKSDQPQCSSSESEVQSTKCNQGLCCQNQSTNMRRCRCPSPYKGAQCGSLVTRLFSADSIEKDSRRLGC